MTARLGRRRFVALAEALAIASAVGSSGCRAPLRDAAGRVRLRLWHSLGGRPRAALLEIIRRFHAREQGVRVEAVYQGDYFESLAKLRTAVVAGAAPALSHVVAEVLPYLAGAGVLDPLDAYDETRALDLVPALSQEGAFVSGGERSLYAVPLNRSTPLMYCNGAMLAEAKLTPPETWDALEAHARALTRPGRWGFEVPIDWWFWVAMVGQAGGEVFDREGRATLGGEAGVEALAFWQRLIHRERVMRPPPGRDYDAWNVTNQDFLSGRAAMIWTSTAYLRYLEDNARFPVIAAPLPSRVRRSVPTGGTLFVVMRGAPEAERRAAARFLRFFCETDQVVELSKRTGYLPVTRGAVARLEAEGFFSAHPNDAVAQRQLGDVSPWPWEPRLFRIQRDIVNPRLEQAVLLDQDPRTLLDRARVAAARPT